MLSAPQKLLTTLDVDEYLRSTDGKDPQVSALAWLIKCSNFNVKDNYLSQVRKPKDNMVKKMNAFISGMEHGKLSEKNKKEFDENLQDFVELMEVDPSNEPFNEFVASIKRMMPLFASTKVLNCYHPGFVPLYYNIFIMMYSLLQTLGDTELKTETKDGICFLVFIRIAKIFTDIVYNETQTVPKVCGWLGLQTKLFPDQTVLDQYVRNCFGFLLQGGKKTNTKSFIQIWDQILVRQNYPIQYLEYLFRVIFSEYPTYSSEEVLDVLAVSDPETMSKIFVKVPVLMEKDNGKHAFEVKFTTVLFLAISGAMYAYKLYRKF